MHQELTEGLRTCVTLQENLLPAATLYRELRTITPLLSLHSSGQCTIVHDIHALAACSRQLSGPRSRSRLYSESFATVRPGPRSRISITK